MTPRPPQGVAGPVSEVLATASQDNPGSAKAAAKPETPGEAEGFPQNSSAPEPEREALVAPPSGSDATSPPRTQSDSEAQKPEGQKDPLRPCLRAKCAARTAAEESFLPPRSNP
eukprot:5802763-Amphidinium_carterae.1